MTLCLPIDGEARITINKLPDSHIFMIGDKVTLTCTVENVSDRIADCLTYQWFRKGLDTGSDTEDMLEETGKEIELPLLTLKDKGSYRCAVKCTLPNCRNWTIHLLSPATVSFSNGELYSCSNLCLHALFWSPHPKLLSLINFYALRLCMAKWHFREWKEIFMVYI
jgi:hypothetical protein